MPSLVLERLELWSFRNLSRVGLAPGPRFNVVHGENGSGKSNLLESIYYLCALRSFRGAKTDELVELGAETARLDATFRTGPALPHRAKIVLRTGRARELTVDGKRPRSAASWHTRFPVVLFHPGDIELVIGGPEHRRALLDRVLEQIDATYGSTLAAYTRALRSRNRLLRDERADPRSIRAFDELLASSGAVIGLSRAELVADIARRAEPAFAEVMGEELPVDIQYRPRVEPKLEAIRAALATSFEKDRARGFTAEGPHADDLVFSLRRPTARVVARHHASQGQSRGLVLALKIAELAVLSRRTGYVPLLLLDDVSSELDRRRNERLFKLLSQLGSQVFLTTTHPEFIQLTESRADFRVSDGNVMPG